MPDHYSESSQVRHDQMSSTMVNEDDALLGIISPLLYQTEQPQLNLDDQDWTGILTPFMEPFSPIAIYSDDGKETDTWCSGAELSKRHDLTNELTKTSHVGSVNDAQQECFQLSNAHEPPLRKRQRRQNHSCDPCRSAKRACDLPLNSIIHNKRPMMACSTCKVRGSECTAVWVSSRHPTQQLGKRARPLSYVIEADQMASSRSIKGSDVIVDTARIDHVASISEAETLLGRKATAYDICSQQFNLYVDIWDMPMTQCLSHTYRPPSYPLGATVLAQLSSCAHFVRYFEEAHLLVKSCWEINSTTWESTSVGPYLFFTASVLDALFQRRDHHAAQKTKYSRDAAINETYKWVAIATAAQFAVSHDDPLKASPRARDIALNTWSKARQLLFDNIAATTSFRVALSLLLFGTILPPTSEDEKHTEDADYAHCEGVRRLQALCANARSHFAGGHQSKVPSFFMGMRVFPGKNHPFQTLPQKERKMILESIGAMEWLASISNWIKIALSRGQFCASSLDLCTGDATAEQSMPNTAEGSIADGPVVTTRNGQGLYDMIVMRAKTEPQTVTFLWSRDVKDDVVLHAVEQAVCLVVLLWKSLAHLTLAVQNLQAHVPSDSEYEEVIRQYTAFLALMDAWRSTFGRFNEATIHSLQRSGPHLRRSVLFCSNDGDLAILQLYDVVNRLKAVLAPQPPTLAKERLSIALQSTFSRCREHRLVSAIQLSFMASSSQGVSSPGFEGKSGLKAHIEDIAAHPVSVLACIAYPSAVLIQLLEQHPFLIVQALSLAAQAFSDELHECVTKMDMKRASEMMPHLQTCLQGLQSLRSSLVMFPDIGQIHGPGVGDLVNHAYQ